MVIRIIKLMLLMCLVLNTAAYADDTLYYEVIPQEEREAFSWEEIGFYVYNVEGIDYISKGFNTNKYNPIIEEKLSKVCNIPVSKLKYIQGERYYLAINTQADAISHVYVVDFNFVIVSQKDFDDKTVSDIGYCDGWYYCKIVDESRYGNIIMYTQDCKNWFNYGGINIPQTNGESVIHNMWIYGKGVGDSEFLVREKNIGSNIGFFADYYIYTNASLINREHELSFSKDGIYYVTFYKPVDEYMPLYNMNWSTNKINDDVIIGDKIKISYTNLKECLANKFPIYVKLNAAILGFEQPPVVIDDSVLVPIRMLLMRMGAVVKWNETAQTIEVSKADKELKFTIGDKAVYISGNKVDMEVPAQLINGRTMIPVSFFAEYLGCEVEWDESTRTISIIEMDGNKKVIYKNVDSSGITWTCYTYKDSAGRQYFEIHNDSNKLDTIIYINRDTVKVEDNKISIEKILDEGGGIKSAVIEQFTFDEINGIVKTEGNLSFTHMM